MVGYCYFVRKVRSLNTSYYTTAQRILWPAAMIATATALVTFVFAGINTPASQGQPQADQAVHESGQATVSAADSHVINKWHNKFSQATHEHVVPVIESCFAEVRKEEPKLSGTIVVRLFVSGEPGASIVVDRAKVVPESSTITSSAMELCVTGSAYDLSLDAPPIPVDFVADVTSKLGKSMTAANR